MTAVSRSASTAAGLALIIAPPVAVIVKMFVYPGWMMLIILMTSIPLILGYALQVVIAARSMLRPNGVFSTAAGAQRGIIAAWVTSVAVILVACLLVDGGDDGTYGSAFTAITGTSSTAAGETLSTTLMLVSAAIWLASWIWLVVEWIVLGVRARRDARVAG